MIVRVRWVAFASVLVFLFANGVLPAGGATVAPLVKISGRSPYASCTPGSPTGEVAFAQTDANARVAASPADPNDLVGVWEQDVWPTGGAKGLMSAWSPDGGQTWHGSQLPGTVCSSGGVRSLRASDPSV